MTAPLTAAQASLLDQALSMTSYTFLHRERTGGVVEGCPREPAPSASQVAGRIGVLLAQLRAQIGPQVKALASKDHLAVAAIDVLEAQGTIEGLELKVRRMETELAELRAKAAGYDIGDWCEEVDAYWCPRDTGTILWNPLLDDGDTLRLANALEIDIMHRVVGGKRIECLPPGGPLTKHYYEVNADEAVRRAVVMTAAAMKGEG